MIYIFKWIIYIPRFISILFFYLFSYFIEVIIFFKFPSWSEFKKESYEVNNYLPEYFPNDEYEIIKKEKFLETLKRWLKNNYY